MCIRDSKIEQHIIAGKRTQQRKAEHCAEAVDDTERQMRKAAAVSYTHLDVYKRQGQHLEQALVVLHRERPGPQVQRITAVKLLRGFERGEQDVYKRQS